MKYSLIFLAIMFSALYARAEQIAKEVSVETFKTFIYTSDKLSDQIQRENEAQSASEKDALNPNRRFFSDLINSSVNAAKGIGGGYVTSFINLGVEAIASLITRNDRLRQEWEQIVAAENKWSMQIQTIQDVKDFYKKPSTAGALDPNDIMFNGIGCLRMEGNDTVFFISCHIDQAKLNRIVNHSKFELVIDTLKISPQHSHIPNTQLPIEFSYSERKNFNLSMNIKLYSSWFTEIIEMHDNAQLGEFTITIPVKENELNSNGYLYYVRKDNEPAKYEVVGESFIVPRSYMGYRDASGEFRNIWGTGQYKLDITLSETCDITDSYRDNWKSDRNRRSEMQPKNGFFATVWQTVSKQKWDDITKQWVITTLSAPAGVISNELIDLMDLKAGSSAAISSTAQQSLTQPQGIPNQK
jgi:hypothetical protein